MADNSSRGASLVASPCAICKTNGDGIECYPARLDEEAIDATTFSARRFHDRKIHFRMVRCRRCGLVRSDPVLPSEALTTLYTQSRFTYQNEIAYLKQTYGRYLRRCERLLSAKDRLLEIGCGNGFFLEEARAQGFREVQGVEPSGDAISAAHPAIRPHITQAMFSHDLFPPDSFDVACLFQTLDHLADPARVLGDVMALLRPGGFLFAFNHNVSSWSARFFGERSPIIDIEHTYLYDPNTVRRLCESVGYTVIEARPAWNKLSLGYLASLIPLSPVVLKDALIRFLTVSRLARVPLWLPLGNMYVIAQKPL